MHRARRYRRRKEERISAPSSARALAIGAAALLISACSFDGNDTERHEQFGNKAVVEQKSPGVTKIGAPVRHARVHPAAHKYNRLCIAIQKEGFAAAEVDEMLAETKRREPDFAALGIKLRAVQYEGTGAAPVDICRDLQPPDDALSVFTFYRDKGILMSSSRRGQHYKQGPWPKTGRSPSVMLSEFLTSRLMFHKESHRF
jgi:hypothetical protein